MKSFPKSVFAVGDASEVDGCPTHRKQTSFYARVQIANRNHIAAAFGESAAIAISASIHDRAAALAGCAGFVSWNAEGLDVFIDEPDQLSWLGSYDPARARLVLQHELTRQLTEAVDVLGLALFPSLSVAVAPVELMGGPANSALFARAQASLEAALSERRMGLASPEAGVRWTRTYVADMAVAALVKRAIADGRVYLAWQPIVGTVSDPCLLYSEGLCRIVDPVREFASGTDIAMPGAFIPALERLGLIRELDAHIVKQTIARLRSDPDLRLGCNISAQSATVDGWWFDILANLDASPEVACRLTIEITETASFANLASSIDFVRALRGRGCRIAIDDFGAGRAAIRDVAALKPDIIKIDAHFLRRLDGCDVLPSLQPLIALAATLALEVVIEGVEDGISDQLAHDAGGRWLQGDFIAAPCVTLLRQPDPVIEERQLVSTIGQSKPVMPLRGVVVALPAAACLWALMIVAWHYVG